LIAKEQFIADIGVGIKTQQLGIFDFRAFLNIAMLLIESERARMLRQTTQEKWSLGGMVKKFYAHSLEGQLPDKWQPLEDHLKNVAEMARDFAKPFGGEHWAYLAGLWHDLGKYADAFQAKLYVENGFESHIETRPGKVVHSEAGGHLATVKGWKGADRILSWLIMGHHAGLTDYFTDEIGAKALEPKMRNSIHSEQILKNVPEMIANQTMPNQVIPPGADPAFFIRMLFSCVVDADFLDTETFMNKAKAGLRNREYPPMQFLLESFDEFMMRLCSKAKPSPVNETRAEILKQCRQAAESKPDVFSLTVPTGGGKTLSSLAFALRHAVKYKKTASFMLSPTPALSSKPQMFFGRFPVLKMW